MDFHLGKGNCSGDVQDTLEQGVKPSSGDVGR